MKQLPICVLALVFQIVGLSAATLDVDSRVDSVTVYRGVAKVTRTFEVDMKAGESAELRFSGLPTDIDSSKVQVGVTDGAALSFGVVTFKNEFKDDERSQTLKDLEAKLRAIEARKAMVLADKKALTDYVQSRNSLVTSINRGLSETGKPELYELSKTAYADAAAAVKEAFGKSEVLDEDLRKVEEALVLANEAVEKQRAKERATSAKYTVDAVSAGGKTAGTISYYVDGVAWSPSYIAKADTSVGNMNISYLCNVSQASGEDWSNITLYLETSRPGAGTKPVEPRPVYLKQIVEIPLSINQRNDDALLASGMAEEAFVPRAFKNKRSGAVNEVTTSFTGFRAMVEGRVTVLSSDDTTVLPLASKTVSCAFHTETIPLTSETAFLMGKLKNGFDLPMLAGPMQAIVDGSTNGTGVVEETLPGVEFTIGLGVNQNIVVERKTLAEKGKEGGLFGGKRVEERSYTTKITNHMKVANRVIMIDRVPISKDGKIVVELETPKDAKIDPEKGTFETEVTIQPGQSVDLPTLYNVTYPSDWRVTNF